MRWLYKYRWSFILFYFFPLCWMYKATLSSNFGVQSLINSIVLSNRGLFVVAFSLIGAVIRSWRYLEFVIGLYHFFLECNFLYFRTKYS